MQALGIIDGNAEDLTPDEMTQRAERRKQRLVIMFSPNGVVPTAFCTRRRSAVVSR